MSFIATCARCRKSLGISVLACPHCGAGLSRARRAAASVAALIGGSSLSATMMACYGGPCAADDTCGDSATGSAGYIDGSTHLDGRVIADVHVATDAQLGNDAAKDAGSDAEDDAESDAASDASLDAPADGG